MFLLRWTYNVVVGAAAIFTLWAAIAVCAMVMGFFFYCILSVVGAVIS
jgi:hypothetical protein